MLPKKGRKLHRGGSDGTDGSGFEQSIAAALRAELDSNHQTIKTVMRWTGASERTVKNWLAGSHGPSGEHLVGLTRYSDEVFRAFLAMAGRGSIVLTADLAALRLKLLDVVNHIDGSAQSAGRQ
ncbi:MAG TPA: hypothetical protein VH558_08160 [Pseudolabrys sp.]|jgi:hypothetical protein